MIQEAGAGCPILAVFSKGGGFDFGGSNFPPMSFRFTHSLVCEFFY